MTIISHLQSLGATHLFTLSNEGTSFVHDYGDSVDPTRIIDGDYSFLTDPLCYGATHCLRSTNNTNNGVDGARFENRSDINGGSNGSSTYDFNNGHRTLMVWARQLNIWNPTAIYEQGAGSNNFAFLGGAQITFQAADAGQPFLIVAGRTLSQVDRPVFLVGIWQHHSSHAGSGNRVLFYMNGVLQGIHEDNTTASFPNHTGDITVGNSSDNLRSFNGTTVSTQTVAKDCNFLGMFNNVSFTESDCRGIFERMVLPEVLIDSDTVANQQAALDALSGTEFVNVNCAIEIRQATDATDYTLTLNNITFVENPDLRDIAVKYVGPHTLTLVNENGSNAVEVAAPPEQDLDGSTVLTGGGVINVVTPAAVTLSGLQPESEVRVFESGTTTEIAGVESSGSDFTFETQVTAVDIAIVSLEFQNARLLNVGIAGDLTIPIQQVVDRQYLNP